MSWQSRVPAVLDALVALWGGTPALDGLVQDGPAPLEGADLEVLSVGHDGGEDGVSTDGVISAEGYGGRPDREQFTVTCLIAVLNGANDGKAARVRAFELLSAASEAVTADRSLGGVVMRAHVRDVGLSQLQTEHGATARVLFTVACDAYTTR